LIRKQLSGTLIFILAGLLFFAIGSGLTYRQRTLEKQGIEAQGEVVALDENYDSDGSTFAPVVRFTTGNGQSVEFKTSYYSSPPEYEIGQSVTVVYPSEEPEKAIIKGDGQLFHIIFMLVGGVLAAIGFSLMYSTLRDSGVLNPEK
jgi:hypothetical protein